MSILQFMEEKAKLVDTLNTTQTGSFSKGPASGAPSSNGGEVHSITTSCPPEDVYMPRSAHHPTLEIHQYDGKFEGNVYAIARDEAILNATKDFETVAREILKSASRMEDKDPMLQRFIAQGVDSYRQSERDPRNDMVATTAALRIAWTMCQELKEEELVLTALIDMARSNGFCVQGRVNRMLQIIAALRSAFFENGESLERRDVAA